LIERMKTKSIQDLLNENELLRSKLNEANDTLEAIRTGQIDALVVNGQDGHSLYTLQSADHAYRVFIEQMAEGAVSLNSNGLIIYSNSQFANIVDLPLSNIAGRHFSEFVTVHDVTVLEKLFSEGWQQNVKGEVGLLSGDKVVCVKLSLNAIKLAGENVLSVIVTDLTFLKEIEKQLKSKNEELAKLNDALLSSNSDLQQFASVASHDLQEPLRKIQVFSKFLKDRSYDELSDASKQYVEKIITCSQRMKVLIVDILTYSKLSAGDTPLEHIDLNELLREILDDFDLKIAEKKANIELDRLCTVEGNKGQLRQVFHNLINNSLKFVSNDRSPVISIQQRQLSAKELGLSVHNESNYCRITVRDNGIGFEEKYSSSIFSLFEKLNPKTTFEGSGIGLAIAKKIIDKHHGIIIAKSTVGLGSEFNVILPINQPRSK
jgi:PAS domain S-box-containing protein